MPQSKPVQSPNDHTPLTVQVAGRHVDLGEALRQRITDELNANVGKYFERGGQADVTVGKDRYAFFTDIVLHLSSGQELVVRGLGHDAHAAFSAGLEKIEGRLRRYKRRLKNHHAQPNLKVEAAALTVMRSPDDDDSLFEEDWGADGSAGSGAPQGAIIAETEAPLKTLTVSMAVMELDMSEQPVVVFRHAAHGGVSVVYRRADGNIGWIDPERTHLPAANGAQTSKAAAPGVNGARSVVN